MKAIPLLRAVSIVLITAAAVIQVIMQFACTKPCNSHFSSRGGLVRHQNTCAVYKTAAALRTERRQASTSKAPPHAKAQLNVQQQISDAENPMILGLDVVRV